MRTVFIGSSRWGLRALEVLLELPELEVVGVVTNPPVFNISYAPDGVRNVQHADVGSFCRARGLNAYEMGPDEKMKSPALFDALQSWAPDLIFVLGWYHLVPKTIRDLAPVLGVHYSLLPDYAGGAPLVWALINREQETGATLFRFEAGVDAGPIYDQVRVAIRPRETIAELYDRVGTASLEMLRRALPAIARGEIVPRPQPEEGRRRVPQRRPADGRIDWRWEVDRVDAFVRAQTRPYPGAFGVLEGARWHIWAAEPGPIAADAPPGAVVETEGVVGVVCGDGRLLTLHDVEGPGGEPARALLGARFEPFSDDARPR